MLFLIEASYRITTYIDLRLKFKVSFMLIYVVFLRIMLIYVDFVLVFVDLL